jgi:iron complex transport system substrate-binding protein
MALVADLEKIIGSWCGRNFRPEKVAARPGWAGCG